MGKNNLFEMIRPGKDYETPRVYKQGLYELACMQIFYRAVVRSGHKYTVYVCTYRLLTDIIDATLPRLHCALINFILLPDCILTYSWVVHSRRCHTSRAHAQAQC